MNREIMQQALNALEYHTMQTRPISHTDKAIEALRQALAQPEQEELIQFKDGKWSYVRKPWVELTDEDAANICMQSDVNNWRDEQVIDAVESRLKEKNGG